MRLLTRNNATAEGQRLIGETTYEIPNTTITWVAIFYLVLNTVSSALSTYIANTPQRITDNRNYELKKQNFELQLLQRVLEIEKDDARKSSLLLLLNARLLSDTKNDELLRFINATAVIPQWPKRPIETFNAGSGNQNQINSPTAQSVPVTGGTRDVTTNPKGDSAADKKNN